MGFNVSVVKNVYVYLYLQENNLITGTFISDLYRRRHRIIIRLCSCSGGADPSGRAV